MFVHIRLMDYVDPADAHEAVRRFGALKERTGGLVREFVAGVNVYPDDPRGHSFGFYSVFDSEEDMLAYQAHPAHEEVVAWSRSRERRGPGASLDFPAGTDDDA